MPPTTNCIMPKCHWYLFAWTDFTCDIWYDDQIIQRIWRIVLKWRNTNPQSWTRADVNTSPWSQTCRWSSSASAWTCQTCQRCTSQRTQTCVRVASPPAAPWSSWSTPGTPCSDGCSPAASWWPCLSAETTPSPSHPPWCTPCTPWSSGSWSTTDTLVCQQRYMQIWVVSCAL